MQGIAAQPMDAAIASSTFIVEGWNVEERTELVPSGDSWIFMCIDRPAEPSKGAVLICPSVYAEFTKNYRCEVLLARKLAANGFVVGRFHYRGTGHSGDLDGPVTAAAMLEDSRTAAEHLHQYALGTRTTLLGTRWGGLIAASLAGEYPGCPVVLAEPVMGVQQIVRDAMRSRAIRELRKGSAERSSLRNEAEVVVPPEGLHAMGYRIDRSFFESAADLRLDALVAAHCQSVLLVQLRRASKPSPAFAELADTWRQRGLEVDLLTIQEQVAWWLEPGLWSGREERQKAQELIAEQLVDLTVGWLVRVGGR